MQKSSVTGKIHCIFETKVVLSAPGKRKGQSFKVTASEKLKNEFILESLKEENIRPTVKFDGTCCLVDEFNCQPWLWARHDVKPNKAADKRFKAFQRAKNEQSLNSDNADFDQEFVWDVKKDFRDFPDNWKPASGADIEEIVPDEIGHIVGWVPVDPSLRTHLWHLSVVDLSVGKALILIEGSNENTLKVFIGNLKDYIGKTLELIGSNVNANPYGIGCKKDPFHVLVQHGEFLVKDIPLLENNITHQQWKEWFNSNPNGALEGIVWHCSGKKMFKLHRHHLELKWPVADISMSSWPVYFDISGYENESVYKNKLFTLLKYYNGTSLNKFTDIFKYSDAGNG